jgi:sec-independent protein translocase protein TatA
MEALSPGHLVVLVAIAGLLFFGWKQLPDMARSAGKSLRMFRTEVNGLNEQVKSATAQVHEARESLKDVAKPVPNVPPSSGVDE